MKQLHVVHSIYGTYTTAMCFLGLGLKGRLTDKEPQQHSGPEQMGMTVTQCIDCQTQPRVLRVDIFFCM